MKTHHRLGIILIVAAALALPAAATPVLSGSGYIETFDSMGTGTAAPDGWKAYNVAGTHDQFAPADSSTPGVLPSGPAIKGGTYNVTLVATTPAGQKSSQGFNWSAGGADRSLGTSPTGIAGMVLELTLTNGTGAPLSALSIDYDIRRFSTAANNNGYNTSPYAGKEELPGYWLFYSLDNGATYTNVAELNNDGHTWPNSPGTTHMGVANYALSGTWAAGSNLTLRWFDDNAQSPSPDQLIGLDNVVITPEPATLSLLALGALTLIRRRRRAA